MTMIEDDILVSVVVPIYNVERYLKRCLDSIINQTYINIEIICVNDGSSDNSGVIAEQYANTDKRIRVIHKENAGLGFARNSGLDVCKGRFVIFVDSDDYIEYDLIEELVSAAHNHHADTVIAGYSRKRNDHIIKINSPIEEMTFEDTEIINNVLVNMIGPLPNRNDSINMAAWAVLYSLDIIKKHQLRFPSERQFISEDIIFNLQYYPWSKKVYGVPNCGYVYCLNPGSLTERYNRERFEMGKILFFEERRLLNELPVLDTAILRAKNAFLEYSRYAIKGEVKYYKVNGSSYAIQKILDIILDETFVQTLGDLDCQNEKKVDRIIDYYARRKNAKRIFDILKIAYRLTGRIQN